MLIGIDASRNTVRPRTGTESYSFNLTRELLGGDSRHRFRLYFNASPSPDDLPDAAASLRVMPFPRLWTHARLSAEMLTSPPDLLFVPAHVLPIVHPRRSVVTVHDLGYLYWPSAHSRSRWWHLHLSTLYNARVATRVIADSTATRDDLVGRYRIPTERIRVVHLGCGERFRPRGEDEVERVRARHGIEGDYVIAVGTLQPRKNLPRLLEAFRRSAVEGGLDYRLVVVGAAGWGADATGRLAAALGDRVRFLGYVPDDDLPGLYSGALALAFPSLYEGFGLPAVEAMACGAPVVASNTSSLPEVVGDAGLLVSPTDVEALASALSTLVTDPTLRAELAERGIRRASGFTWRRCAGEVLRVLEEAE